MLDAKKLAKANETRLLSRLEEKGRQTAIATAMGVSESTISRLKGDSLSQFCEVLAHAGLKIVPTESKTFPPSEIDALLMFAKRGMAQIHSANDLGDDHGG